MAVIDNIMSRFLLYVVFLIFSDLSLALGDETSNFSLQHSCIANTNADSISDQPQNDPIPYGKNSVYVQFSTSGLYPSLTDWKNQLHLQDGTHPTGTNIVFGAEAGYVINEYIQIAMGYEFFFTTKVSTVEAVGDQINSTYLYGSLRGSVPLESIQNLSLFSSIDVGSLSVTEAMEYYYGQNYDKTGSTTAYRLIAGSQYYMTEDWSMMLGAGYFFGNVNTVMANGQTWPNYSLNLSGFVLRFAVNYHIPL
jgi:hypothetical protein